MICISIKEQDFDRCLNIVRNAPKSHIIELRADLCNFSAKQIEEITSITPNLLITCRTKSAGGSKTEEEALQLITTAIRHGAKYADIEIEASSDYLEYIKAYATANSCKLIISYHNFKETPQEDELRQICDICYRKGAHIAKIVTTAHSTEDAIRVLRLYRQFKQPLIAFAMGEAGKFTRKLCLNLGSPLTYCSICGNTTAPGQLSVQEIEDYLNPHKYPYTFGKEFCKPKVQQSSSKTAIAAIAVTVPCSKSMSQRAIIMAALAKGTTTLQNYSPCNDSQAAIGVIESLGCTVEESLNASTIKIVSPGIKELNQPGNAINLNVGESALLARLMLPLSAVIFSYTKKPVTINGNGSILKRDLSEATDTLRRLGAECSATEYGGGKLSLPITIQSGFGKTSATIDASQSSQTISGLLIALPLLKNSSNITICNPTSIPYINLTLATQKLFEIENLCRNGNKEKISFSIEGKQEYQPGNIILHPDWSSAAYFKVLELMGFGIELRNMQTGLHQADEAINQVCQICKENNYRGFVFDAGNCPDLFPILAVLALMLKGESRINGVGRLLEKESNRAESICSELIKVGADIKIEGNEMIIEGRPAQLCSTPALLDTHNDHRIAMSLIVMSILLHLSVKLNNIKCIDKSFPQFVSNLYDYLQ